MDFILIQIPLLLLLFFMGAITGSFLNVVVYRTTEGKESWKTGRSRCDHCGQGIAWYDNIPLLSYFILGGACRYCKKEIAFSHVVMELLVGVLFVWWYGMGFLFFQLSQSPFSIMQPLFWLAVGIFFIIIVAADMRYFIIPDYAVLALTTLTIVYRGALLVSGVMRAQDFGYTLIAMVITTGFFFGLWWLTKGKGMGFGDVKLMIPLTLLLGWPKIIVAIFLAFSTGAVIGIALFMFGKKKLGQPIPFGPFLIVATIASLLWGNDIWHWYIGILR